MNYLNNLLWIGIFSQILHIIGASDPEPKEINKNKTSSRQEKGLEIEIPFKVAGQSSRFNLNNYESLAKFGGKTCSQGVGRRFRAIGSKPAKNIKKTGKYAAKIKKMKERGIKPQPQKNLRFGFFDPLALLWGASGFSGQASVSGTPNNYNSYCDVMCSTKFSFFSNGECFKTSPYYANKPCDCMCKYITTDYANTEYGLCTPDNPDKCNRYCQGLDPDYVPYNAGYDDIFIYKIGRCSQGQCYCCGKYDDWNMIDTETVDD